MGFKCFFYKYLHVFITSMSGSIWIKYSALIIKQPGVLLPKLIVTIGFQFRESTRALDCRCREAWFSPAEGKRFRPRILCLLPAQPGVLFRLLWLLFLSSAQTVLQRGRELLPMAAEKARQFPDRMPTGPCAAGLWSPESCSVFLSWETYQKARGSCRAL